MKAAPVPCCARWPMPTGFMAPKAWACWAAFTPNGLLSGQNAVEELIRRCREAPGEITLVTLGPLTNIAAALTVEPRLADWVKECFIMGGNANCVGNVTPAAEFNIWCDPEAARIVFHSGMKMLMVGWEHCRFAARSPTRRWPRSTPWAPSAPGLPWIATPTPYRPGGRFRAPPGLTLADPITMAIALDPSVCARAQLALCGCLVQRRTDPWHDGSG